MKQYWLAALALSLFLIILFSPDQAITIFYQGAYLLLALVYVVGAIVVVLVSAGVYVVFSILYSGLNDLFSTNLTTQFILDAQSDALGGLTIMFDGFMGMMLDVRNVNERLMGVDIYIYKGQLPADSIQIIVDSLQVIIDNVVSGVRRVLFDERPVID